MSFNRCYACMAELPASEGRCPKCGKNNAAAIQEQPRHVLPCGTVLAQRYVIGRVLGQGGFGITYIGWDLTLGTRVCIKEYFPDGAAMRDNSQTSQVFWDSSVNAQSLKTGRENLVKEASKAAKLRDLNSIVTVWSVFYDNETAYIVMEYAEGKSLKDTIAEQDKPLQEGECLKLFRGVAADLSKAHERGIIHRDISPDNLMLRPNGSLVLLDMGAAKDLSGMQRSSSLQVTKAGYSPVEQYSRSAPLGPWTDVYALCATMVYCLNGSIQPSPMERMSGRPLLLNGVSPRLAEVMQKGLAMWPAERIQSMDELLTILDAVEDSSPESVLGPIPSPDKNTALSAEQTPTVEAEPKRSRAWLKWSLAGAALICVLLVFFLQRPNARQQDETGQTAITGEQETLTASEPQEESSAASESQKESSTASETQEESTTSKVQSSSTTSETQSSPTASETQEGSSTSGTQGESPTSETQEEPSASGAQGGSSSNASDEGSDEECLPNPEDERSPDHELGSEPSYEPGTNYWTQEDPSNAGDEEVDFAPGDG